MDCVNRKMFCSKGIVQSVETIPHEMEVTSSNISPPLIRTCKKKKKKLKKGRGTKIDSRVFQ